MEHLEEWIPFFRELTKDDQELIENTLTERYIAKNETVYNTSMDCIGVMIILSGQLRAYMVSDEGKEITLYRLLERDMCLFSASCVMKNIDFEIQIEAKEDTQTLVIPIPTYQTLMNRSLPTVQYMNSLMASRFSDVMWVMDQVLNQNLDTRLGALLLQQSQLSGSTTLKVTHEELAGELGSAREVISRMLKYLQEEGMVRLSRGKVDIVNEELLYELAEGSLR